MEGDAQVVVGIDVVGIAGERLGESMNRSAVLSVRIQSQTEELVGLGVLRIHAESGARFRDRVGAVIETIEDVGQTAVVLGKVGHELRRPRDLVESIVPALLLAEHRAQSEVQGGILGSELKGLAKSEFGFVEVLSPGIGGGLHQGLREFSEVESQRRSGRLQIGFGQSADQSSRRRRRLPVGESAPCRGRSRCRAPERCGRGGCWARRP